MDLCFVNVEQLKNFKIGSELKIELIGESFDSDTNKRLRHYLVNGTQVNWKYWSNPVTKDWQVERTSNIDYITKDISDVVLKGRLDSNYLSGLKK